MLPFQNVSFSYSGNEEGMLYKNLEFGIDCDSRIALVGPNGAGGCAGFLTFLTSLAFGGRLGTHGALTWTWLLRALDSPCVPSPAYSCCSNRETVCVCVCIATL